MDNTAAHFSLLAAHVAELLAELQPLLAGAEVRDVWALPPHALVLVCARAAAESPLRVFFAADPDGPRFHLLHARVERHTGSVGPFYERARNELLGAKLRALEQPAGDRVALFAFARSSGGNCALLLELFGRQANLIWLDGSEKVGSVLHEPSQKNAERLAVGQLWRPPLPRVQAEPAAAPAPSLKSLSAETLISLRAPLSLWVENVLSAQIARVARERARTALAKRLRHKLERAAALEHGLSERARAAAGAGRAREDGELLKANLGALKRGQKSIEVEDWFAEQGGSTRRIELDPKLAPQENVARIFARYQKLERSAVEVERELRLAQTKRTELAALLAELENDADPDLIERRALDAALLEPLAVQRGVAAQKVEPRTPYRRYTAASGAEILVGKTAADNDELTFRVARGNDLWLHSADSPGSHVVLRVGKGQEPEPEDVLDAAHLAVHYSPRKAARVARVHVARAKGVHKPRGAKPGLVTLSQGKEREIRLERERLARLLGQDRKR